MECAPQKCEHGILGCGEFQPWAAMGAEAGGQVTRTTYDVYASYGWASSAWSYKLITNAGGQGNGTLGLVTNAPDSKVPALDFNTASMAEIEALFKQFGSVNYEPQQSVMSWMNASNTPKAIQLAFRTYAKTDAGVVVFA